MLGHMYTRNIFESLCVCMFELRGLSETRRRGGEGEGQGRERVNSNILKEKRDRGKKLRKGETESESGRRTGRRGVR